MYPSASRTDACMASAWTPLPTTEMASTIGHGWRMRRVALTTTAAACRFRKRTVVFVAKRDHSTKFDHRTGTGTGGTPECSQTRNHLLAHVQPWYSTTCASRGQARATRHLTWIRRNKARPPLSRSYRGA
jgi:hypothetical protein